MKIIATIYEKDIFPKKNAPKSVKYSDRITGKAIVFGKDNKIALVGNKQNEFFQLPGGGINTDEEIKDGVRRECAEEIGCMIKILEEVGCIDDFRPRDKKHCINYCYTAQILDVNCNTKHTKDETKIGMYTKWFSIKEAVDIFRKQKEELGADKISFYNTGFNIARDLLFMEYAITTNKIHG